ncbi:MAG: hypothetical protein KAT75_04275 [Dehalococcoidia bacterium]|nr:hypothetical protein [Dehalococcoidia bacterium]
MKWTPIVAIVCIAALEVVALLKGINGAVLGIVIAALAGLGGYEVKVLRDKVKGGKDAER